jgi:hypothetical protein
MLSNISQNTAVNQILGCIDQTLNDLGTFPPVLVYMTARRSFGVSKEEVAEKPEFFEKALERVFGESRIVVEESISRKLVESFNLSPGNSAKRMVDLITELGKQSR